MRLMVRVSISMMSRWTTNKLFICLAWIGAITSAGAEVIVLDIGQLTSRPTTLSAKIGESDRVGWSLPEKAEAYYLPIAGGVEVAATDVVLMTMLRERSPWSFSTLPALGARHIDLGTCLLY